MESKDLDEEEDARKGYCEEAGALVVGSIARNHGKMKRRRFVCCSSRIGSRVEEFRCLGCDDGGVVRGFGCCCCYLSLLHRCLRRRLMRTNPPLLYGF